MSKNAAAEKEPTGTEVVDQKALEERQAEIEKQIRQQVATVGERTGAPSQNKISVSGKKFTFPGGEPKQGPLMAIVLDSIWVMAHYPGRFDQNNPQDPNCFAVSRLHPDQGGVAPHENSPEKQADNCASCPKNQWGSDPGGGKGKACKSQKRLLIVPPDATEASQPYTIYVSPTAIKKWDAYERELATMNMSPIQVVTEIDFDPNLTYPSLTFKFHDRHSNVLTMWGLKEKYVQMTEHVFEIRDRK